MTWDSFKKGAKSFFHSLSQTGMDMKYDPEAEVDEPVVHAKISTHTTDAAVSVKRKKPKEASNDGD